MTRLPLSHLCAASLTGTAASPEDVRLQPAERQGHARGAGWHYPGDDLIDASYDPTATPSTYAITISAPAYAVWRLFKQIGAKVRVLPRSSSSAVFARLPFFNSYEIQEEFQQPGLDGAWRHRGLRLPRHVDGMGGHRTRQVHGPVVDTKNSAQGTPILRVPLPA